MLDIQLVAEDASWRERLFSMLGSEDGRLDPISVCGARGNCSAGAIATSKSYLLTMSMWHEETVNIIRLGSASGEFHPADSAENIARRLIALVCGLDGIYALGMEAIDDSAFTRYINHYIALELLCPPTI